MLYRLYVAGPMTHIAQYNFPAFDRMAEALRRAGYDVVSPAELDDPNDRAAALASPDGAPQTAHHFGKSWGDFLARDVKLIADGDERGPIDGIVVLPGWQRSRGARLETFVGRMLCDKQVFTWDAAYEELRRVSMLTLAQGWLGISLAFHQKHPMEDAA